MTQETQETIKFARHWLEIADKHGDLNAPTTGCMTALAKAVVALAEELQGVARANMDNLEALDHQEFLLDKANAELAELKDKARWRKRSEESALTGEVEALIQVGGDYVITHAVVFNDDTAYEKVTGRRIYLEYWRPLDLPEKSK